VRVRVAGPLAALACAAPLAAVPAPAGAASLDAAVYGLAGRCVALAPAGGGGATPLKVSAQATGLGTFLLQNSAGQLLGARGTSIAEVGGPEAAGPGAEWAPRHVRGDVFTLQATATGTTVGRFTLTPATGCRPFPEADLGVTGTPASSRGPHGTVRGIADAHVHITADMRGGGEVFGGEPFDRFGIVRALGQDAAVHGADGSQDVTGNLLRDGVPFGTHDTGGWPAFKGWPTFDTNTHEQIYYRWLERAWRGGLRLAVAQTVEDALLCKIEPRHRYSCDETTAIRGQIARLKALRDYVDAQSGGPGRGWLRIVESPGQARRVIRAGKLAVVIGIESSFPLGCRDQAGVRPCTAADVDRRLDAYRRLGVRSMFLAHWADNGLAGAAVEGGVKGKFINAMQRVDVGHFFEVGACPAAGQGEELEPLSGLEISVLSQFFPATKALAKVPEPAYPKAKRCNVRGLTPLGAHVVRAMMRRGMLIEADHLSERARDAVLRITGAAGYPVVSGHTDTGGTWSAGELAALKRAGGVSSQRLAAPEALAKAIVARPGGLGTDTGGFASLPGPHALAYPFRLDGQTFTRQQTGERRFDLAADGMAHYGLLPDLLAAMARAPQGRRALAILDGSAERYLRMWERAQQRR
jgi:microsomal dipeptidase-like Zn-dependent dipeptidase